MEKWIVYLLNYVAFGDRLIERWGRTRGEFRDTYLGLPFGAKYKKSAWWPLIDKFRDRLSMWKRKYPSQGGRLVLVNSKLASLTVFFPSLFIIPFSVAEELEKNVRNFLWGSSDEEKKYHIVVWDSVCLPMVFGGVRFQKIPWCECCFVRILDLEVRQ